MQGRQRRRNVFGFGGAADECMVGKNQCPEKHIVHICSRNCIFISVMLKLMGFPGKYWGGGGGGGGATAPSAPWFLRLCAGYNAPTPQTHTHTLVLSIMASICFLLLVPIFGYAC